jgi:7,8-dihydroneopterin aldolase/epimerase/oxygenase
LAPGVAKFFPRASASSVENALSDYIRIEQLEVSARVGVTEMERAQPQRLSFSILMSPARPLVDLADDVRNTINYSDVCQETRNFVRDRADKLIETLADGLAAHLLKRFAMHKITIEVRKFVVPDTKFVAVTITRTAAIS